MPDDPNAAVDWQKIAASSQFKALLRAKRRFIIPAMIFFIVYYFALPVLVGYARPFMERRVIGPVNVAYLFALSQFFMAWIIAALYIRVANRFDRQAREVISRARARARDRARNRSAKSFEHEHDYEQEQEPEE